MAVGLAMDASAAAITNGMCNKDAPIKYGFLIGLYFGGFQAAMPLIGYYVASGFRVVVALFDHWIALIILSFLGLKMIYGAVKKEDPVQAAVTLTNKSLLLQAFATSIDALIVGVGLAVIEVNIALAVTAIGVVTFVLSIVAFKIGQAFGGKLGKKAEILGGAILIVIGLKIFIEHIFV
jgi:putative Mn2+ efflux pump MntP